MRILYTILLTTFLTLLARETEAKSKKHVYLKIVKDVAGHNSCPVGDSFGPCHGRVIYVKNTSRRTKYFTRVGCGSQLLQAVAIIPPKRTQIYEFLWGGPGNMRRSQCRIEHVVPFKKRRLPPYHFRLR